MYRVALLCSAPDSTRAVDGCCGAHRAQERSYTRPTRFRDSAFAFTKTLTYIRAA